MLVDGNIVANQPLSLYLGNITVHGNVVSNGGGTTDRFYNFPIKDNVIDGNLVIHGWTGGLVAASIAITVARQRRTSAASAMIPAQAVVTSRDRPDGAYYVSELTASRRRPASRAFREASSRPASEVRLEQFSPARVLPADVIDNSQPDGRLTCLLRANDASWLALEIGAGLDGWQRLQSRRRRQDPPRATESDPDHASRTRGTADAPDATQGPSRAAAVIQLAP